jgi:hypothetical protein
MQRLQLPSCPFSSFVLYIPAPLKPLQTSPLYKQQTFTLSHSLGAVQLQTVLPLAKDQIE